MNGSLHDESDEEDDHFQKSPGNTPNPTRRKMRDVKSRRPTKYVREPPKVWIENYVILSLLKRGK